MPMMQLKKNGRSKADCGNFYRRYPYQVQHLVSFWKNDIASNLELFVYSIYISLNERYK